MDVLLMSIYDHLKKIVMINLIQLNLYSHEIVYVKGDRILILPDKWFMIFLQFTCNIH